MPDYSEFLDTVSYGAITDLSDTTVSLCLLSMGYMTSRRNWTDNGLPVSDSQWDNIDAMVALAMGEIMSNLVGLMMPSVMATISAFKFLPCDGGIYNKADYPLLYDAIYAGYIVSGTQFRVPDLRDRVVVGTGNNYSIDDSGGSDSVVLTTDQLPAHTHTFYIHAFGVDIESVGVPDPTGVGQPELPRQTGATGGNQAHENRMPYRALDWVIIAG